MKKLPSNYDCEQEFVNDMLKAKAGSISKKHKIWNKMCFKQIFKEAENWSIAYVTFNKAIDDYDMSRLPINKNHTWQFACFFSQRVRRAYQTERYNYTHALNFSEYGWKNTEIRIIELNEEIES